MADKRISQLVDRGTVANNDVVPIVVNGASTTNKATISSIQTFMQGNLDLGVTSVGLSMPSAFSVSGSPVTSSGNISVVGAGTVGQYIRGNGTLADFPSISGGGSSVSYYLNGSVSQGTIGGVAYLEMNKVPILGAGTDFNISANGYIASFITDAGDPALLQIPGGNWNFETYFSASSAGGSPSFYIELYKVNLAGTSTLIASNSATPEAISFGSTIHSYFSSLAVPTTSLLATDRLALRYFVTASGKTITLHTENGHLCQIITTFTTGLTALNGLTAQVQNFATGTSGTDFNISSTSTTHTFNIPSASASNRGLVTTVSQTISGAKTFNSDLIVNGITVGKGGASNGNNTAVGLNSLSSNTTGTLNTATGLSALQVNTAGNSNTANGANSLLANTTGGFNTAIGSQSLYSNTTGQANTAIGLNSLYSNSTGTYNTGIGSGAGYYIADGSTPNTTSDFSIYLGADTKASVDNAQNETVIGYNAIGNGSNTVTIGNLTVTNNYFTGNIRGGAFIKSGGTTSQFLKADGSVDSSTYLTTSSAASTYLPLVGGTLTGALNGTSASFTASIFGNSPLNNTIITTTDATNITNGFNLLGSSSYWGIRTATSGNFNLDVYGAGVPKNALSIAQSTGAATFSSSVTASTGYYLKHTNTNTIAAIEQFSGTQGAGFSLFNSSGTQNVLFNAGGDSFIRGGNVGIGTTSPSAGLEVITNGTVTNSIRIASNVAFNASPEVAFVSRYKFNSSGDYCIGSVINTVKDNTTDGNQSGNLQFWTNNSGSLAERMRITSVGNVLVGRTSAFGSERVSIESASSNPILTTYNFNATAVTHHEIRNQNGIVGTIVASGGSTAYNTSSDYRLKQDFKDFEGIDLVGKLKVYDYEWKVDESRSFGVIAHELQEVIPNAVHGEKDAVDKEGNDIMQGVDYSKIVPVLIKAIQELKTEIDSLKNQIK